MEYDLNQFHNIIKPFIFYTINILTPLTNSKNPVLFNILTSKNKIFILCQ